MFGGISRSVGFAGGVAATSEEMHRDFEPSTLVPWAPGGIDTGKRSDRASVGQGSSRQGDAVVLFQTMTASAGRNTAIGDWSCVILFHESI